MSSSLSHSEMQVSYGMSRFYKVLDDIPANSLPDVRDRLGATGANRSFLGRTTSPIGGGSYHVVASFASEGASAAPDDQQHVAPPPHSATLQEDVRFRFSAGKLYFGLLGAAPRESKKDLKRRAASYGYAPRPQQPPRALPPREERPPPTNSKTPMHVVGPGHVRTRRRILLETENQEDEDAVGTDQEDEDSSVIQWDGLDDD